MYLGEKLTRSQAEKRAMMVGISIAGADAKQYASYNNTSVRALSGTMLNGKLGRVSIATYENARAATLPTGKTANTLQAYLLPPPSAIRCSTDNNPCTILALQLGSPLTS